LAELYLSTGRIRKSLFRVGKSLTLILYIMKKTFYFSLMAILVLLGCSKVENDSAVKPDGNQFKAAPVNGSVSWILSGYFYYLPIECDGVEAGFVYGGPIDWHIIDHYKNGEVVWTMYKVNGSLTNIPTGEVFKIQESDKLIWSKGDYTFHANLIGNQGGHYILSGRYNPITGEVFIDKAVCPNGPKN
jgi:hypothetical protein